MYLKTKVCVILLVGCSASVLFVIQLPLAKTGPEVMVIAMPLTMKHGSLRGRRQEEGKNELGLVFCHFLLRSV